MTKNIAFSLILLVLLITGAKSYTTVSPTWINNPYFCAGNDKVLNSNTNGGQTRTQNIPFTVAFSGVPTIAYGIKSYRGTDQLWETNFAISCTNLAQNNWRAQIQLFGTSNMYLLQIQYLAVDPAFPYHLNVFNNVPIQYSSTLSNITASSSALTSYTRTINYSQQASGQTFNTFSLPLSSNRIVLYINCLILTANTTAPLKLQLSYTIINSTTYSWTTNLFQYGTVTKLHVSEIVYNADSILSSNQFIAVEVNWATTGLSASQVFESNFQKSMICGLTYFGTPLGRCALDYEWKYVNNLGGTLESIQLIDSIPSGNSTATCGQNLFQTTLFYIKTWNCPGANVYFNLTTDLCQNACASYYYFNFAAATCTPCYYACYNCTTPTFSTSCSQCETGLQRYLVNNTCLCLDGYFDDGFQPGCQACADVDPNSLTCTYAIDPLELTSFYQNIFNQTTWATDILPNFTSITCVTAYFINNSRLCQPCPSYCITCTDSVTCTTCNSSSPAILYSNNLCYLCNLSNCLSCYPDNICVSCSGVLVVSEGVCMTCVQACVCQGWVLPKISGVCSTLCGDGIKVGLEECDDGNTNDHDGCSSTCILQPCSLSCLCDGWTAPWNGGNSSCTSICGDTLVRGMEECDDGNFIDHDGCSATCTLQPCSISCLCDGWYKPWITQYNKCTTICGDGYARGDQQCDDGNLIDGDGCDSSCHKEIPPLMTVKMSQYPSLILFLMGFRIVGLQALNVLQNFQLICDSMKIRYFRMSFNIHGFSDSENFPLPIPQPGHFLTTFNFMYFFVVALFFAGVLLQIYSLCFLKDNKVLDSNGSVDKHHDLKSGSDEEDHSDVMGDFTVHYKGENKLKVQQPQNSQLDESQIIPENKQQLFVKKTIIIIRQVFFHLMINLLCNFAYSISYQVKTESLISFVNVQTLIIIISMIVFFTLICLLFVFRGLTFGQNLLKFNKGEVLEYWILLMGQKVVFAAILGSKFFWNIELVLLLKFALLMYYWCTRLYFDDYQKFRSVVTHFIHFMLIFAVVINEHLFKNVGIYSSFPPLFMEYIYLGLLCLVLLICVIFYAREVMQDCEADLREFDDSERVYGIQNGMINAVFAAKNFDTVEDSAQNFVLKTSNILDEIKIKRSSRTSAFLDFPSQSSNLGMTSSSKFADTNHAHSPHGSETSLSHLLSAKPKRNASHVRSQRGSNMMSVLEIEQQRQSQIEQISVDDRNSQKKQESDGVLQNGVSHQQIKVKFNESNLSQSNLQNQPYVIHAPKGFKNYGHHLALANKKRRIDNHKVFKTDEEPQLDETQLQSGQKLAAFQTDNVINESRKQSRQMTFHRGEKKSAAERQHQQEMKDNVEIHQIKVEHKNGEDDHETVSINLEQEQ